MNSIFNTKSFGISLLACVLSTSAFADSKSIDSKEMEMKVKTTYDYQKANSERAKQIFQAEKAKEEVNEEVKPEKPMEVSLPKEPTPEELQAQKEQENLEKSLEVRTYKISFEKDSKFQPKLEAVTIKGQIYQNRNPLKRFEIKTNDDGELVFEKDYGQNLAISLYYIQGEEQHKVRCQGYAPIGQKEVKVSCR